MAAICRTQQLLRKLQADNGSDALSQKNGETTCQHGYISQGADRRQEPMLDKFPEDILNHIYSLLPMQDAARAACVSLGFLHCWRHYPRLVFDNRTLGWNKVQLLVLPRQLVNMDEVGSSIVSRIDHTLKNHCGFGVKVFILELFPGCCINFSHLDRWLEIAVKPGIEELALKGIKTGYKFPCSLLSNEIAGATIQSLCLSSCAFHPALTLGCKKSLTSLDLCSVHITEWELGQFLSNCPALVRLVISDCDDIICFRVPCPLQQLDYLEVKACEMLQVIEVNAPELSTFVYGEAQIPISLGGQLEIKAVHLISCKQFNMVSYARVEIPSLIPNVERLTITSPLEMVTTPMMPSKFLHLKCLNIYLSETICFNFDFFSLVSFLDAAPALETFILFAEPRALRHDSILDGDWSHLRQMPQCRNDNLENVTITGFSSAKSMIELTCHIIQNASSLKCITLDTTWGDNGINLRLGKCMFMRGGSLTEANKALEAFRRYIAGKVPSGVNLQVLEPCGRCHYSRGLDAS